MTGQKAPSTAIELAQMLCDEHAKGTAAMNKAFASEPGSSEYAQGTEGLERHKKVFDSLLGELQAVLSAD